MVKLPFNSHNISMYAIPLIVIKMNKNMKMRRVPKRAVKICQIIMGTISETIKQVII